MTEEQGKARRAPERGPLPPGAELVAVVVRKWGRVAGYVGYYADARAGWYALAVLQRECQAAIDAGGKTTNDLEGWCESCAFDDVETALAYLTSFELAWCVITDQVVVCARPVTKQGGA